MPDPIANPIDRIRAIRTAVRVAHSSASGEESVFAQEVIWLCGFALRNLVDRSSARKLILEHLDKAYRCCNCHKPETSELYSETNAILDLMGIQEVPE